MPEGCAFLSYHPKRCSSSCCCWVHVACHMWGLYGMMQRLLFETFWAILVSRKINLKFSQKKKTETRLKVSTRNIFIIKLLNWNRYTRDEERREEIKLDFTESDVRQGAQKLMRKSLGSLNKIFIHSIVDNDSLDSCWPYFRAAGCCSLMNFTYWMLKLDYLSLDLEINFPQF